MATRWGSTSTTAGDMCTFIWLVYSCGCRKLHGTAPCAPVRASGNPGDCVGKDDTEQAEDGPCPNH